MTTRAKSYAATMARVDAVTVRDFTELYVVASDAPRWRLTDVLIEALQQARREGFIAGQADAS